VDVGRAAGIWVSPSLLPHDRRRGGRVPALASRFQDSRGARRLRARRPVGAAITSRWCTRDRSTDCSRRTRRGGYEILHASRIFKLQLGKDREPVEPRQRGAHGSMSCGRALSRDDQLDAIHGYVEDREGRWTVDEALRLDVPAPSSLCR